jgi:hypothetical protein
MMGWDFALLRWSTLRYAENVGSQFHSLRQRSLRIRSPPRARSLQKPNNGGLFRLGLWTAILPRGARTFSPGPIFSEPLDSAILVQSFEVAPHRHFLRSPRPEVGMPLPRIRETWLEPIGVPLGRKGARVQSAIARPWRLGIGTIPCWRPWAVARPQRDGRLNV